MVIASYTAYEFTVKLFKILYVSLLWQFGNKSDIMTLCFTSTAIRSQFQSNRNCFSALLWHYMWLKVDISVKWFPFAFANPVISVLTSVSEQISMKTISPKFQGFWAKSFADAVKYCLFHNDSINLAKNTGEGKWFSGFLMILPKHVYVDRNLPWRLELSISFMLKHIFIYFLYFVQLA